MSVTAEITVTLAEVEVTDDYRVAVKLHQPAVDFAWWEAEQLANELIEAVVEARNALREDFGTPAVSHGFDVDMAGEAG